MVKMKAEIQKCENNQKLRLPQNLIDAAEFAENDTVEIAADKSGIRIQKVEHFESIDDLFYNYKGNYKCGEIDPDAPIGKEVW